MSRTLKVLGSAVALIGVLSFVGCSSGSNNTTALNRVAGGSTTAQGTLVANTVIPANGITAQFNSGGAVVNAFIPGGFVANATNATPFLIIKAGSQPFAAVFNGNGQLGVSTARALAQALANNNVGGAVINAQGVLQVDVAIPLTGGAAGTFVALALPLNSVQTRALDIASVTFEGKVYFIGGNIISPIPLSISGTIPNNGENAVGGDVTCTFGAGNNGRHANLRVEYGNGFILNQTQTIANLSARFRDMETDAQNVPGNGVSLVAFTIGDLPNGN
jgi:hypothetical protein